MAGKARGFGEVCFFEFGDGWWWYLGRHKCAALYLARHGNFKRISAHLSVKSVLPKRLTLLVLVAFLMLPLVLHAQSGRNKGTRIQTDKSTDKTTDTQPAPGVNDSRINPEGETVEGDVIRTDTALVTVPVTVLDRSGRYVPLLKRENFRILENGVEQKIAYFAATDSPFTVILLIDTSGSTHFRLDDIQSAAINFVSKLKSNDNVMVMSFDDRIDVLCKATNNRDEITRAIRRTRTGGGTRLYDAVEDILKKQLTHHHRPQSSRAFYRRRRYHQPSRFVRQHDSSGGRIRRADLFS